MPPGRQSECPDFTPLPAQWIRCHERTPQHVLCASRHSSRMHKCRAAVAPFAPLWCHAMPLEANEVFLPDGRAGGDKIRSGGRGRSSVELQRDSSNDERHDEDCEATNDHLRKGRGNDLSALEGNVRTGQRWRTGDLSFSSSVMSSMLVAKNCSGSLSLVNPVGSSGPLNCIATPTRLALCGVARRGCSTNADEVSKATSTRPRARNGR